MEKGRRNANIADSIFLDLRHQILSGQLKVGERLTGERELATKYGTNRNTLREAVRKLEQTRLVTVRHGQGVTVADFRVTGTLELLVPYLQAGANPSEVARAIRDMLEPRVLLLEYATRLAVRRADRHDVERIRDITELLISAFGQGDPSIVARGFQRWLDALVDAGHSMTVRWFANPMFDAYRDMLERYPSLWVLEPSFPAHLESFLAALTAGDEERAVHAIREYYERVDSALVRILDQNLPDDGNDTPGSATASPPSASSTDATDAKVVPMRRERQR